MSAMPVHYQYQYGKTFQISVLSVLLSDGVFARSNLDAVIPAYFDSMELAALARIVLDHYRVRPTEPMTLENFRSSIVDYCIRNRIQEDRQKALLAMADEVLYTPVRDPSTVKDRIIRFGQRQALKRAIGESIEVLEKDSDYGKVRTLIDKALMVGMKVENTMDFADIAPDLPKYYEARAGIRTLIGPLDRALLSGGIAPGEFAIIGAPPKYGKSTVLVNMGAAAIAQGKKVLHVSYEGGLRVPDVAMKYACRMTGYTATEIASKNPGYYDSLRRKQMPSNLLKIGWFAPGTQTVVELRSYINHLIHNSGFTPDMLILDYPDKMKVPKGDYLQEMNRLYDQITELLNDFGMAGWGGSQGGRGGFRVEETGAGNIEGTWMKVANADVVIMLSQTKEERACNPPVIRAGLEAVRRGEGGFKIPLTIDYARSWVNFQADWYKDQETDQKQQAQQQEKPPPPKLPQVPPKDMQLPKFIVPKTENTQ